MKNGGAPDEALHEASLVALQADEVKQGLPEALLDQAGKSKMLEDEAKKGDAGRGGQG
jgi:hypothetical protein